MIFLTLLALIATIIVMIVPRETYRNNDINKTCIVAVATIATAISLLLNSLTIVPAGSVGVQRLFGRIYDQEISEGIHLINPFTSVKDFRISVTQFKETHEAETSDTQTVHVDTITNISLNPNLVAENVRLAGEDFLQKFFKPVNQESVRAQIAKHKVTDLIAQRAKVRQDIHDSMRERLETHGILLGELALSAVDFSDKYDAAIEEKQVEEQTVAKRVYELKSKEQEALIAKTIAEGKANAAIEDARGEAEALRLKGQAQAEYNKLVSESLSPLLISHTYLNKWGGVLPTHILGNDSLNLLLGLTK